MKLRIKTGIMVFLAGIGVLAQQSTDYLIVDAPIGVQAATRVLWVKWAGTARAGFPAPDSGTIYFDRSPGGGKLSNYRYMISVPYIDTNISTRDSIRDNIYFLPSPTDSIPKRGTAFRAADQMNMGVGVFYCVVAKPANGDTLVSNEFQIIIESPEPVSWIGPTGKISNMTPTFHWSANTGVPYYHVILSDDLIKIDSSSGEVNLKGLSIIWQAITPSTQMVYGAPDLSRTITADPPPLSPGQNYTWVVLNNYGNHMALSSMKVKLPAGSFSVTGTPLNKPEAVYPKAVMLKSDVNKKIQFKWKNLDAQANTYKIYIYVGSDFEGIDAQLVVYQTEVVADGRGGADEIDSVEIDAATVLTSNKYVWRVIAVDDQGAGTVGDTAGFRYESFTGSMRIYTKEQIVIGSGDSVATVVNTVGLVQLKVEVLDGSLEAPLLFYTDLNGILDRIRPTGTYRVTAIKNEFEQQSKTIVVRTGEKTTETFYLERPDATVFGKVLDEDGKGINLATVYGVSDRDDTVTTNTDALGNFILNCYAADWRISVSMTGYESALPRKITVTAAENFDFQTVKLKKNPFTLSGTVNNSSSEPLLGVRVCLYSNGTPIGEIPSTPENGAFSFTVPSGTYALTAEKTGFTSYSKSIDIMSSKAVTVVLEPGATLVTGYIYGRTWVGDAGVLAPITGARVRFIRDGADDTVTVTTDQTYGDFRASLPGGKSYRMFASASGFVIKSAPVTFTTELKTTQQIFDTLQGLGIMPGMVTMSSGGLAVKNVSVSLVDLSTGTIVSSGESDAGGRFELNGIPDGLFLFRAGKDGLVLDSVGGRDTVTFSGGRAQRTSARLYLKPGDKTLRWRLLAPEGVTASVKIQSPVVKTVGTEDSIVNTGPGLYIIGVDAAADSVIDLSCHRFTVADSELTHIDTVDLRVIHVREDTVHPVDGRIRIALSSGNRLDSVSLFFKDAIAASFDSIRDTSADSTYAFSFVPPRDGSVIVYYFKVWRGADVYGYDRETYSAFVAPDTSMLTRFEIIPSSEDGLSLPSKYSAVFELKAYVSSVFLPDSTLPAGAITWSLENAQGTVRTPATGLQTTVTTGSSKTSSPVILKAMIDTAQITLAPGLACSTSVRFMVTGAVLKSITVIRSDNSSSNLITTSPSDFAEFIARGEDADGTTLDLSPVWSVDPPNAGTIQSNGVFRARRNFAGMARIWAKVGSVSGEYRNSEQGAPGLNVRYVITGRSTADTVGNQIGCRVVFPANVVSGSDFGYLEMLNTNLKNQFMRGFDTVRTIDTLAFDLNQLGSADLDLSSDSLRIVLDIPKNLWKQAAAGKQNLRVAQWHEDSLVWKQLDNSKVAGDGKTVSAALTHFSRYCVVYKPSESLRMDVAPNPFSPYIIPHHNPFDSDDRVPQRNGTCLRIQADKREARSDVKVRIYNILGDQVWSMLLQNADNLPYYIWWDGRTSTRELHPSGNNHVIAEKGDVMCRNGRYFAVVSVTMSGKEQRKMSQIVLMK